MEFLIAVGLLTGGYFLVKTLRGPLPPEPQDDEDEEEVE